MNIFVLLEKFLKLTLVPDLESRYTPKFCTLGGTEMVEEQIAYPYRGSSSCEVLSMTHQAIQF